MNPPVAPLRRIHGLHYSVIAGNLSLRDVEPFLSRGNCPFCKGRDSFEVHADGFYCEKCDVYGDAITFLMRHEGLDFISAVHRVDLLRWVLSQVYRDDPEDPEP